jgi:hypothetical protein
MMLAKAFVLRLPRPAPCPATAGNMEFAPKFSVKHAKHSKTSKFVEIRKTSRFDTHESLSKCTYTTSRAFLIVYTLYSTIVSNERPSLTSYKRELKSNI